MSFPVIMIILLVLVVAVVFFLRSRSSAEPTRKPTTKAPEKKRMSPLEKRQHLNQSTLEKLKSSKQFWGACIDSESPGQCCEAALAIQHDPYSFDKLPTLPLAMCDKDLCLCHYIGVKERRVQNRRTGHDRREEIRFDPNSSERRAGKDRRSTQDVWLHHDQDS